uniref:Uncharacterized protein n=1 Tax=Megaselia scalaris TaxID=36166 RepID=T1GB98_MEGSC
MTGCYTTDRTFGRQIIEKLTKCQDAGVVRKISSKRISFAGHLVRMVDDRPAKQVFFKAPSGTRRGQQRTRWVGLVDKDNRNLGISCGEEHLTPETHLNTLSFLNTFECF